VSGALVGFAFPFKVRRGGLERAAGMTKIEQDLRLLLTIRPGERVMARGYGGGVHHRLQEPSAATLRSLLKHDIERALRVYMPAVRLAAPLQVRARNEEVTITIQYSARPSEMVHQLQLRLP
jgi:phage baseplate assembly protein W